MDRIEKILLGSEDVINRGLPDIFLNVDLKQNFKEIKKEIYENTFDIKQQFDTERNTCRNFRIYGVVNSTITDCDNLSIQIFKDSGLTQSVKTIQTTPLEFQKGNIFNKKTGKYYIELDNFLDSTIYLLIPTNNFSFTNQLYEQKIIFYDADSNFVPYGTQTVDIMDNGNLIEINNDFPFFYNKHWIKNDLDITETKITTVQFAATGQTISEGGNVSVTIELGRPSIFGNETVDLVLNSGITTADAFNDFSILINNTPVNNFSNTLIWSVGEQFKTLEFVANNDLLPEFDEFVFYDLKNHYRVLPRTLNSDIFTIKDNTTRTYTNFNLGTMWANRYAFSGRGYYPNWSTVFQAPFSSPSIFRNGHFHQGRNEEFWPLDYFYLEIHNQGNDSIIPPNPILGTTTDTIFRAGTSATFKVWPIYTSSTLCEVKIYIPPTTYLPEYFPFPGAISINGFNVRPLNVYQGDAYRTFLEAINGGPNDFYINQGLEKPFIISSTDQTGHTINLRSVSNGVTLDINTKVSVSTPGSYATATTVSPFIYSEQLPLSFSLLGNDNGNNQATYDFIFRKPGYSTISMINNSFPASSTPVENYLITSYRDALIPYDSNTNSCILPSVIPDNTSNINTYLLNYTNTSGPNGVYTYGICFLTNKTSASNIANFTSYGDNVPLSPYNIASGNVARFIQNSFVPLPCTFTSISINNVAQKGILVINGFGVNPSVFTVKSTLRGFEFQNGTGQSQTYYKNLDNSLAGANNMSYYYYYPNNIIWSSSTVSPIATHGLKELLDTGNPGWSTPIPVGPVYTTYPAPQNFPNINHIFAPSNSVLLEAKTPGVPFNFNKIYDIIWEDNNHITYTGNSIYYIPITPSEAAGVTLNLFKNRMGGFTINPPL